MIDPDLLHELEPLALRFASQGHRLYLVGGLVRDQRLGRPLGPDGDIDLTTDAHPPTIKKLVAPLAEAVWTQGERFGTIGCIIGGRSYEITTHRGESYDPESRKPNVAFTDAVENDLARRDFTINAMAVALPGGELVDPFDGVGDLAAGRLRTPLEPTVSFSDDPLRMLRAARFIAGYDVVPDAALLAAVDELAPRMAIVSVERRRDELDKLLLVPDPRAGIRLVLDHGLASFVLPAMGEADDAARSRAMEAVASLPAVRSLRLAALVAPEDTPDRARAAARLRELRYSNDVVAEVDAMLAGLARIVAEPTGWTPSRVRRLAMTTRGVRDDAVLLASTRVDTSEVEAAIADVSRYEDLDDLEPALDGNQVMSLLGLAPGADVGVAIGYLKQLRLDEGPISADAARERLTAWWSARG